VAAILTGNRDRAAQAMSEHLEGSAVLLRGFLA
jgi:DNA-binding FadR family transcriptional regulator